MKQPTLTIGKVLQRRTREAQEDVAKATGKILRIARRVVTGARAVAHQVTESVGEADTAAVKQIGRLVTRLRRVSELTAKVVKQTEQVLCGNRHIPDRLVSLCDPDARPIRKGKLKAPMEFGYKVLIQETVERLVTGYQVFKGNPVDHGLLPEAIERQRKVLGHVPKDLAADRGFGTATNDRLLAEAGVKRVALPRPGKITGARKAHQLAETEVWHAPNSLTRPQRRPMLGGRGRMGSQSDPIGQHGVIIGVRTGKEHHRTHFTPVFNLAAAIFQRDLPRVEITESAS